MSLFFTHKDRLDNWAREEALKQAVSLHKAGLPFKDDDVVALAQKFYDFLKVQ